MSIIEIDYDEQAIEVIDTLMELINGIDGLIMTSNNNRDRGCFEIEIAKQPPKPEPPKIELIRNDQVSGIGE